MSAPGWIKSQAKLRSLAIMPKVSGSLSAILSAIVVVTVLRDKRRMNKAYHRLVLGISFMDMISSFWFFLSTWPIEDRPGFPIAFANGSEGFCKTQAFFLQFARGSAFYNFSLTLYFLLAVRYGWKERQLNRLEPYLHAVPWSFGIITAFIGLFLDIYGSSGFWCWISTRLDTTDSKYSWALFYGPMFVLLVAVAVANGMIYHHVRRVENMTRKYKYSSAASMTQSSDKFRRSKSDDGITTDSQDMSPDVEHAPNVPKQGSVSSFFAKIGASSRRKKNEYRSRTMEVATQCFWFTGIFYLNWIPVWLSFIIWKTKEELNYPLLLLSAICTPMQGLPNAFIYLAPKFRELRRNNPDASIWSWLRGTFARLESSNEAEMIVNCDSGTSTNKSEVLEVE